MDFSWGDAQNELYSRVVTFAQRRLNEGLSERIHDHRFALDEWRACGDLGLLGLSIPAAHGGMGLSALETARMIEGFGYGCEDTGLVFSASAHLFACGMPIVHHGSEQLRARALPRLARGEWIGANAITEAEAGSDVFAMRASAERQGAHYAISGEKTYVTNGPVADVFVVYARTNPADGYLGISAFAVEKGTPGLVVGKPFAKAGLTTSPVSSIYLERCLVPVENRIGEEGAGAAVFAGSMGWERACLFAGYVGAMERQLERTLEHARSRRQFRKPIGKFQAIAHRVADMKLRLEASRLLVYRACWLLDRGADATLEISLAKVAVSEAAIQSALDAIQIHGGAGYMEESGIERALRDALPTTIFSGTSEIQRDIIAKKLGL